MELLLRRYKYESWEINFACNFALLLFQQARASMRNVHRPDVGE
jgi:hypothetical protein